MSRQSASVVSDVVAPYTRGLNVFGNILHHLIASYKDPVSAPISTWCMPQICELYPPHNVIIKKQMILHHWLVNTAQWTLFGNTIIFVPGLHARNELTIGLYQH